jgi:NHL repeat
VVVGQTDFTSSDSPDPPTAQSLSEPADVASDGKRLFVADTGNSRVLVYSPFPTANNPAATIVLGQPDLAHNNAIGPTAQTVGSPFGISVFGKNLFVADDGDSRILIFSAK